jgi:5'-3' exonuclease
VKRRLSSKFSDTIILIDFNNQVWRNHHATERKMSPNSDGIHTGSIIGLTKTLLHAINRAKEIGGLPELVICEDRTPERKRLLYSKNQDCFKEYIDNNHPIIYYKGNRKSKDLDYNPVEICREFMSCVPHRNIFKEGEEADDVLASFIRENSHRNIILYSSDRDMWQLLDKYPNLKIYLGGDGEHPTEEMLLKKFDTKKFKKVVLHKLIRGDSGDNVKGVKNYQFKRTLKAFKKCDGTLESYFYKLVKIYGIDCPSVKKLIQPHNLKLLKLNKKLVKLKTDIDYEEIVYKKGDIDKWQYLCHMFETPSLLRMKLMDIY